MKNESSGHLKRAEELLVVANENLEHGHPPDSISRSYFAMVHCATDVLGEFGIKRSSHHALWSAFGQYATGEDLLPERFHRYGLDAFSDRSESDYLWNPTQNLEDAEGILEKAREFVAACGEFLENR